MTVLLDYGIPIASALVALPTFYQGLIDKIIDIKIQAARNEEHLRHIDKDIESIKKKF